MAYPQNMASAMTAGDRVDGKRRKDIEEVMERLQNAVAAVDQYPQIFSERLQTVTRAEPPSGDSKLSGVPQAVMVPLADQMAHLCVVLEAAQARFASICQRLEL